jgi:hypothetical protein
MQSGKTGIPEGQSRGIVNDGGREGGKLNALAQPYRNHRGGAAAPEEFGSSL